MRGPSDSSRAAADNRHARGAEAGREREAGGSVEAAVAEAVAVGGAAAWDAGIGGCESGFTLPTPGNPDIVWATCYGNQVTRYDAHQDRARSVSPGIHTLDSPPTDTKYRCHWTPPLAIDPFDPNTVYYGCQVIFKTSNAGQTWTVISPDLSTNDSTQIVSSGGIIGDNLGQFYGEVVFAIAPSAIQRGLIWAGTNDGQIWNTRDGGGAWTNVTKNISGLADVGHRAPDRALACSIRPPRTSRSTRHLMDDREPYIYKTTDYGKTWTKISDALPTDHPLSYAMAVAENPEPSRHALRRHRTRVLLLDGRRRDMDAVQDRTARRAGKLDRGRETRSRRGDLHVRTRAVRAARHHAAGAGGSRGRRRGRAHLRTADAASARRAAETSTSTSRSRPRRRTRCRWRSWIRPAPLSAR